MANIDTPTFSIHQVHDDSTWWFVRQFDDNENDDDIDDETNTMIVLQVYPEQLLGKIAKKAFATLGCSADEFFEVRKQKMKIFGQQRSGIRLIFQDNVIPLDPNY